MKRFFSLVLVLVMVMSLNPVAYSVEPAENKSVEEILDAYHYKISSINNDAANRSTYSLNAVREKNQIKQDTMEELAAAGYEAYDVNPDTYESVADALQTDLSALGITSEGSYIVVVSGEPEDNSGVAPAAIHPPDIIDDPIFYYTYEGETLTMRYITIYADTGYGYAMSEDIDLVKNSNDVEAVENILNSMVYYAIDEMLPIPLGSLASIFGLQLYNFNNTVSDITMKFNANTNWTRTFTQVWYDVYEDWMNGSCVEYVNSFSYSDCDYYDRTQNRYLRVTNDEQFDTIYSSKYSNYSWRKQKAAIGFINGVCYFDQTGPVKYYLGDDLLTTHEFIGIP